ncbi:MAG: hypothetical protein AAGD18_13925 [Actinomycetota bacterium]
MRDRGAPLILDDSVYGQHFEAYIKLIGTEREFSEGAELRTDIVGSAYRPVSASEGG